MSRRPLAESLMAAGIVGCCLTPWISVGWLRFAVVVLGAVAIGDAWIIHWNARSHAEQVAGLERQLAGRQVRDQVVGLDDWRLAYLRKTRP